MPSWWAADFVCQACSHRWDELVDRDKKDEEHEVECPACELTQTLKRAVSAPMQTKESLPDGYRRKHDPQYQRIREATKLKREAVNMPYEKRADHYKEISELRKTRPKDKGKRDLRGTDND